MVERPFEASDDRPQRGVVVPQERHHLFRLGALRKTGEAAYIAEHDDDFAAMAFKDAFVALRDDEVGELWCEEPPQFASALDLGELRRDACLQFAVPACDLLGALAQFTKQPRV